MLSAAAGDRQFLAPFGAGSPTQWAGLLTQRHMAEFGTTEEQFGHHVIAQRYHASMNDDAIFRDPLTMDEYLAARYVSKPLRILDCDYPVDSGAAVIFTTEERARDMQQAGGARRVVRARARSATSTSRSSATWCGPRPRRPRARCGHAPT